MKQKLEEAAKEYAESVIDSFGTNGVPNGVSDIKDMIALGFENGTSWLSNQIKSIILDDTLTDGEVIDNINELLKPTRMYWNELKRKEIDYER
jgi:hypothetical protein